MAYQLHPQDRQRVVRELAKVLQIAPIGEGRALLQEANELLRQRVISRKERKDGSDPFWFENKLVSMADEAIAKGEPYNAWLYSLNEHNHGHSGFADSVRKIYMRPIDADEEFISDAIREMIIRVAKALFVKGLPVEKKEQGQFGKAGTLLYAMSHCLELLGSEVPRELIVQLKQAFAKYDDINKKKEEQWFLTLKRQSESRYGC
jgi:hypothetical protein